MGETIGLRGAIVSQNGTGTQNYAAAVTVPQQPLNADVTLNAVPTITMGLKHTSQYDNQNMAISAKQDGAGTVRLAVNTFSPLTMSAPTAVSVGVASAEAVPVNTSRRYLLLVNTSGATISLGFGAAAVLNSGVTLTAGSAYEILEGSNLCTAQIRAIASAAASNLAIQEGT